MTTIFLKVLYLFLIVCINLYIGSYAVNKISARSEHRRGFTSSRLRGAGYPMLKMLKYLEKDSKILVWEFLLLFFSFFIWTIIPFTQWLDLIRLDADLLIALLFYIILLFLFLINSARSSYGFIFRNLTRNVLMVFTFLVPVFFSIASLVLINRTLTLKEIVGFQYQYWNIIYQPLGFVVFFIYAVLQVKLFGLTKVNTVLYSENIVKETGGFGRLILRIANYMLLFFIIVLMIILYLAGWQNLSFVNGNILFIIKFYAIFFIILLLDRATPSINDYKYLESINWKFLIPVSAANFLLTMIFFILRNIYNLI
jgi:NADH-quinone oxidoreductase subunit H